MPLPRPLTRIASLTAILLGCSLAPTAAQAGFLGQKCLDDSPTLYRCGYVWQTLICQKYYSTVITGCAERNRSCCNLAAKSTELPY